MKKSKKPNNIKIKQGESPRTLTACPICKVGISPSRLAQHIKKHSEPKNHIVERFNQPGSYL